MTSFFGIDTSNYTTSVALFNSETLEVKQEKLLLPVKAGELGLRQSATVFHHVKQLPIIIKELFNEKVDISAIGVSTRPRNIDGSRITSYNVCYTKLLRAQPDEKFYIMECC